MNSVLARFLISVPGMLLVAFGFNYFNHRAYYTTIRNTQTVDFNILTNTLPTKLSLALQVGQLEEIQRTINSNYGLFGIVVTDCKKEQQECKEQQIIAMSQPKRKGWGEKQFPEALSNSPYNVLRNTTLLTAEWEFKDARSTDIVSTKRINYGEVIGRVYYIRRDPPIFIENQLNWLKIPIDSFWTLIETRNFERAGKELYTFIDSGSNKYYFLTNLLGLVIGLSLWRVWEQSYYERNLQEKLHERELSMKSASYEKSSSKLEEQVRELEHNLSEQKKIEKYLQDELSDARKVIESERQETQTLKGKLLVAKQHAEAAKKRIQILTSQLEFTRQKVKEKWEAVSSLQKQLELFQYSDIRFIELQGQLKEAIQDATNSQQTVNYLSEQLSVASENLKEKKYSYSKLAEELMQAQSSLKSKEEDILDLQNSLSEISAREKQHQRSIKTLEQEKVKLENEKKDLEHSLIISKEQYNQKIEQDLANLCDSLGQEIENLRNKLFNVESEKQKIEDERDLLLEKIRNSKEFEVDEKVFYRDGNTIEFKAVYDALKTAEEHFPILEIWDSAKKSAYRFNHYLPNSVYRSLAVLADVGEYVFYGYSGISLDEIFRSEGVRYSPRESPSTMNNKKYAEQRIFQHQNKKMQMVRHLKVGKKLRIYFEFDEKCKKISVGYCGKHLPTSTG